MAATPICSCDCLCRDKGTDKGGRREKGVGAKDDRALVPGSTGLTLLRSGYMETLQKTPEVRLNSQWLCPLKTRVKLNATVKATI